MTRQSARRKSSNKTFFFLVGIVILGTVVYLAYEYIRDKRAYDIGHAAYLAGDCRTAIEEFGKLGDGEGWIVSYSQRISDEKGHCEAYLRRVTRADSMRESGDGGGAFLEYVGYLMQQPPAPLVTSARLNAQTLLGDSVLELFGNLDVCDSLPEIRLVSVVPDEQRTMPTILLKCGFTYEDAGEFQKSLDLYEGFLNEFRDHEAAGQIEQLMVNNPLACKRFSDIEPLILINQQNIRADFYNQCVRSLLKIDDPNETLEKSQIREFTDDQYQLLVDFLVNYPDSQFAQLAEDTLIQTQLACDDFASIKSNTNLSARENLIPRLYYECGLQFIERDMLSPAIVLFEEFLERFPGHKLASEVKIVYIEAFLEEFPDHVFSSDEIEAYIEGLLEAYNSDTALSSDEFGELSDNRYYVLLDFLIEYPEHALTARAEDLFVQTRIACNNISSLKANSDLNARSDFLPKLYLECGQRSIDLGNEPRAVDLFDTFLEEYPGHELVADVEEIYADLLLTQAGSGSGSISAPERSGNSGSSFAKVIIQNDTPNDLKIVFRGPETQITTIPACDTCQDYSIDPLFCPKRGPIIEFLLPGGDYDVLVESQSGDRLSWTGDWSLDSEDEYNSCFYIVTTTFP